MTGSNPAEGALRQGQRPRLRGGPREAPRRRCRPITLLPSNAHPRAAIGPSRTASAPHWSRCGTGHAPQLRARYDRGVKSAAATRARGPAWPWCLPRSPQCDQARPSHAARARTVHTWPGPGGGEGGRDEGVGTEPAWLARGRGRGTEAGGGRALLRLRRAPAQGPGWGRRARASPHRRRRAGSRGAAPTLIGLGGAAKLSAHVAWPRGDGRGLNSAGAA